MSGLQQPSSQTSAHSTDSHITNTEKTLNESSYMVQNNHINATYAPNDAKMKHDFTRFGKFCKKSGRTIKFCWSSKKEKHNGEKPSSQLKQTYFKNYPNRPKLPSNCISNSDDRSNAQGARSDSLYVANRNLSRRNSYSGTVCFDARPDKLISLYDTLQSCNVSN